MMRLVERGLVFDARAQPAERRAASFVGLGRLTSGALWCGFQVGPKKHDPGATLCLCRSDDGGARWHELPVRFQTKLDGVPGSLAGCEIVEIGPERLLLVTTWFDRSDPNRPLFDPQTEGILYSRLLVSESCDGGWTWGPWRVVPTPGLTGCSLTGPILRWPDGTVGLAFESYKVFDDPRPARHGAWLMVSRDGGETFGAPLLVAQDPNHAVYYWDQRLAPTRRNGELVAMFWTHDRSRQRDLNVHLRWTTLEELCGPGTAASEPGLARWQPVATSIRGQIATPLVLPDGRLVAVVVDRAGPGTITLWQSPDHGQTWPPGDALVIYTHDRSALPSPGETPIEFAQYWDDMLRWSFGHPTICLLDARHVLVAYYAGPPDAMSVHWAKVDVG